MTAWLDISWGGGALLPAVLAGLATAWFFLARRRSGLGGRLAECAALLLLAAGLLQPVLHLGGGGRPGVLVLRDVSMSVETQAGEGLSLPAGLPVREVRFAAGLAGPESLPDISRTEAARALAFAEAEVLAGRAGAVVLMTDGRFTDNWRGAAARLGRTSRGLWIVPLDAPPRDGRVAGLEVLWEGEAVRVAVDVRANASMTRRVRLLRRGPDGAEKVLLDREVRLRPARPRTVRVTDVPPAEGRWVWEAELLPHDALPVNDWAVGGEPVRSGRVAWVSADRPGSLPDGAEYVAPDALPPVGPGPREFDAVVLADAGGELLDEARRASLARYVRGGGGLVLLGAGPARRPSDRDDPLNRVAALLADPFRRRPIDLRVVLDASGSMAGAERDGGRRFDKALEACLALREHLTGRDRLGVVVFSDRAREVYRSEGPADFAELAAALRGVSPAGPTNVGPALRLASAGEPGAGLGGLVLVLSDLQTAPFDVAELAGRFAAGGWSLAVVGVGRGPAAGELAELAGRLDAPLRVRQTLEDLAAVFGRMVRRSRDPRGRTGTFTILPAPGWEVLSSLPQPMELLLTAPAAGADVLGRVDPGAEPLLGIRRVGLGRSATLALGEPSAVPEPVVDRLLEAVRRPAGSRAEVELRFAADGAELVAKTPAPWRAQRRMTVERVRLDDPAGRVLTDSVAQAAPGVFRVRFDLEQGLWALRLRDEEGGVLWGDVVRPGYGPEVSRLGADFETLRELAGLTGGRIVRAEDLAELAGQIAPTGGELHLGRCLLACGLAVMLARWAPSWTRRKRLRKLDFRK